MSAASTQLGPPVSAPNVAGCLGRSPTPSSMRSGNRGRGSRCLSDAHVCGAPSPEGVPAVGCCYLEPKPRQGRRWGDPAPKATQDLCGSLWAPGAGLRLALTAQKPEGPAGESALKVCPGASRLGESVLRVCPGASRLSGLHNTVVSASLLGGGAEGVDSMKACVHTWLSLDGNAQKHSRNFHKMSVLASELCGSVGTPAQPAHGGRALGVDGDHLPAAAPDQQHPVQPLGQDLKELHVCSGAKLRMQPTSQCMPRAHLTSQELCGRGTAGGGGSWDPGPSEAGDGRWARGTVHPPGPHVCPATTGCRPLRWAVSQEPSRDAPS